MSCGKQKSYLIAHACSRAVLMHIFAQLGVLCPRVDVVCGVSFGLLNSVICSAERLYEGELCYLGHRMKLNAFSLLYNIYHRMNSFPMNEYLHHFVATRNTRTSAALVELTLAIPHCRIDQFSRSFLPAALCLWNLLSSGVSSGSTFSSFKSAMNLYLQKA